MRKHARKVDGNQQAIVDGDTLRRILKAEGEPVSDEERLMILRMLHEQKITSEQAEKLLAALEGSV